MKWLLLGYGDLANKRLAAALQDAGGSELDAVWGRGGEKAESFAKDHSIPKWFSGPEGLKKALASKDIEAVYVCTPVHTHFPYARMSREAGKHVLCEKPLFVDAQKCAGLTELLRGSSLRFGAAYYRRCYPKMKRIYEIVSSGETGSGVAVNINHHSWFSPGTDDPKSWRVKPELSGGGPTADVGSHRFDLLAYWFGGIEVDRVLRKNQIHDYPAEDTSGFLMHLPDWNGAVVTASFSWASRAWIDRLTIVGSEMILVADPLDGPHLDINQGREYRRETFEVPVNAHLPLVEDFVRSVNGGGQPICPIEDACRTDAILTK